MGRATKTTWEGGGDVSDTTITIYSQSLKLRVQFQDLDVDSIPT